MFVGYTVTVGSVLRNTQKRVFVQLKDNVREIVQFFLESLASCVFQLDFNLFAALPNRWALSGLPTALLLIIHGIHGKTKKNEFWLAGGGNLEVEVSESDLNDLVRPSNEAVQDAVDVRRVDLRVIWGCKDALLTVIITLLITDVTAAVGAAAADSTFPAVHDALTCYIHIRASSSLHRHSAHQLHSSRNS